MIKAGPGTGGQIASSMAYRPEYNQLRGEMVQLRKAAADKNCRFTPGAVAPGSPASGPAAHVPPADRSSGNQRNFFPAWNLLAWNPPRTVA